MSYGVKSVRTRVDLIFLSLSSHCSTPTAAESRPSTAATISGSNRRQGSSAPLPSFLASDRLLRGAARRTRGCRISHPPRIPLPMSISIAHAASRDSMPTRFVSGGHDRRQNHALRIRRRRQTADLHFSRQSMAATAATATSPLPLSRRRHGTRKGRAEGRVRGRRGAAVCDGCSPGHDLRLRRFILLLCPGWFPDVLLLAAWL